MPEHQVNFTRRFTRTNGPRKRAGRPWPAAAGPNLVNGGVECNRGGGVEQIGTSSSVSPDEFRAAAEVHRELGPDYDQAVVESFLQRLGPEIDARVDARVADELDARVAEELRAGAGRSRNPSSMKLAIVSMALGIPLTAIALGATSEAIGLISVLVIWLAMAVINVAFVIFSRPASRRR